MWAFSLNAPSGGVLGSRPVGTCLAHVSAMFSRGSVRQEGSVVCAGSTWWCVERLSPRFAGLFVCGLLFRRVFFVACTGSVLVCAVRTAVVYVFREVCRSFRIEVPVPAATGGGSCRRRSAYAISIIHVVPTHGRAGIEKQPKYTSFLLRETQSVCSWGTRQKTFFIFCCTDSL